MAEKEQNFEEFLKSARQGIDALDNELLKLLSQRANLVKRVGEWKSAAFDEPQFCRLEREQQILAKMQRNNPGPLPNESVGHVFREIISVCFALEASMSIAYLGPAGSFTHAAAHKHFGHNIPLDSCLGIEQIFRQVSAKSCQYGVVPVENSTEGMVNHTLDMFLSSSLRICGEVLLPIHHHLLSNAARCSEIRSLYSHPQSLAQCRIWLNAHLPHVETFECSSNSEAARLASLDLEGAAAISTLEAATIYKMNILDRNLEDHPDNTTRFLVIGHEDVSPSGSDKTSIVFSGTNRPGSLYDLLAKLSEHKINMLRIESRPSRMANWDYVFFVDLDGHIHDPVLCAGLEALKPICGMFRHLGSYPKALENQEGELPA
ncbi:MAG: prephenate dehydratase [Candidatus Eutrophobiaceae bacterium]